MPPSASDVSVVTPISPALQRVKTMLFAPFDLKKWFIVGFCAWLAACGESGGGGGGGGGNYNTGSSDRHEIRRGLENAWEYIAENLYWILPVIVGLIVLGLAIWVVATWLNSRGKFMFLHCVALDRAEVQVPWTKFGRHANSLFWFQVILGFLAFLIILPIVLASVAMLMLALCEQGPVGLWVVGFILGIFCAVGLGILFAIVKKMLVDFVVPIMFLQTPSVRRGWGEFSSLLSPNIFRFILYLLFSFVLHLAIGMMILVMVIATCCIAGCLFAIPYIGTVLLLPFIVFGRSYSLYYLAQYGSEFDVFAAEPAPTVVPSSPSPGGTVV